MSNVIKITSVKQYEELVHALGTVVLKVSTSTCAPCKMMNPLFDKLSEEDFGFKPIFASITADESDELTNLAKQLNINAVPSFIVFKDGTNINQFAGAFPLKVLKQKLDI